MVDVGVVLSMADHFVCCAQYFSSCTDLVLYSMVKLICVLYDFSLNALIDYCLYLPINFVAERLICLLIDGMLNSMIELLIEHLACFT